MGVEGSLNNDYIFMSPQSITVLKSYPSTKVASKQIKKTKIDNRTTEEIDISTMITWHANTLSQLLLGHCFLLAVLILEDTLSQISA